MKKQTCPVLFEDEHLVVIDKPSGLLSVPDRWDKDTPHCLALLTVDPSRAQPFVVHRLDKGTSGVVLFAKTPAAHKNLSLQFEARSVLKEYWALVQGIVPESSGSWNDPLAPNPRCPGTMVATPYGKPSRTDYDVVEKFAKARLSWLCVKPQTGRTHQIRVHARCAGHPVVGDVLYGSGEPVFLSRLKKGYKLSRDGEEKPLLGRLALHAGSIEITHPETGSRQTFTAPLAKDLRITLNYLRKFGC